MHKIFILTRILLKSGGLLSDSKGKNRWWLPILLGIAFLSLAFSMVMMTFGIYEVLEPFGLSTALVPLAFGITSVFIFFFGIFYTVSVMYHATDVQMLLPMPLRPYQIIGAKFLTLVIYEYVFEACVLLPMLVAYGIRSGSGALYYVYGLILFALLPVIALVMASVIVMLVMRFTRFGKNKQAFNFVGGIIAIGLAIGFNLFIQTSVTDINPQQLVGLASQPSSLIGLFPGISFAADALINSASLSGLFNLLLFILCTAAATALFLGVAQLIYFKGLAGITEAAAKRKKLSSEEMDKVTVRTSVIRAYVMKELHTLVRSPVAFLNCVLMNFIWPVLIVMMMIGNQQSMAGISALLQVADMPILVAIMVAISAFVASGNGITSTAISREGQSLYFTKYIPVSMEKQLLAKVLTGILLSSVGVILLCVAAIVLGANVLAAIIALVLGLAMTVVMSLVGLLIDCGNPKLTWANEQQAIKQNTNVLLHMLLGLVAAAIIAVPPLTLSFNLVLTLIYIAALATLMILLLWNRVSKGAAVKLVRMDV